MAKPDSGHQAATQADPAARSPNATALSGNGVSLTVAPLPWVVRAMSRDRILESARVIFDANDDEVCSIDYEMMPTACPGIKHSEVNARRIVHCVNAHDELVMALEKLADAVETRKPEHEGYLLMCAHEARAALALARGAAA
jgi:hypothetical protein